MFTVRSLSAALLATLLLSACGKKTELAPDEVIRRAVIRSNTVESVAVALSADMKTEQSDALSGSVIVQAIVRAGGQTWSADTSFNLEATLKRGHERASGRLVTVSPGTGQTYLRLESADGTLGQTLRKAFTGSLNGWMLVGQDSGVKPSERHTPDPAMLSSYADVIVVKENLGNVPGNNGHDLYHYRVALKTDRLSSMPQGGSDDDAGSLKGDGEMWIDTTDFSLVEAKWSLGGVPTELGPLTVHADALFSDYDTASQIVTPAGSASTLPLESIFAIFSS